VGGNQRGVGEKNLKTILLGWGGGGGQNIVTTWQPKKKVPENPTKKVLFEEKWHKITTFPKKKKSQIC